MFYTLLIYFVLDGLLQLISFRMFSYKHLVVFENAYLLKVVDRTVLKYFISNIDSVKLSV